MSNDIITKSEQALRALLPKIRVRDCALFLGAGISQGAGYASSDEIARRLYREASPDMELEEAEYISLPEAAQMYEKSRGYTRRELVDHIKRYLKPSPETRIDTEAFDLIAHIPQLNAIIITTNWDNLMEEAIKKATEVDPMVVINDFDVGKAAGARHTIYKIHGSLERPETVVVTQADYRRLYSELRSPQSLLFSILRTLLAQKTIVYIGYSLTDPDFEVLLNNIQQALTDDVGNYVGKVSYAVMEPPKATSSRELGRRQYEWERKHVKIIWRAAGDFCRYVFTETAEFVNREREFHQMTSVLMPKYACLELVGNAGSGKTRLLQEMVDHYKYEREWANVCYLDLKPVEGEEPPDPIADVARELRIEQATLDKITGHGGLLLAFDSIERSTDEARRKTMELAEAIVSTGRKDQRVIWATRYSLFSQLSLSIRPKTFSMSLSPFDETSVVDMVKRYIEVVGRERKETKDYEELARTILQLTGSGHPGFIMEVLKVVQQQGAFSPVYLETAEGKNLVLGALMVQMQRDVLPKDQELASFIMDTLCVLRGITRDIVAKLMPKTSYRTAEELYQAVIDTHLWDEGAYPLVTFDPVIRYVLVWYLREVQVHKRFEEVNRWASDYFQELLPQVSEDLQRSYFHEWLYHQAMQYPPHKLFEFKKVIDKKQQEKQQEQQQKTFEKLKEDAEGKLKLLSGHYPKRMRNRLVSELQQDSELAEALRRCIGDERYDALLNIIGL